MSAQKSTGFIIAQNGTRSDGRFQRPSESGSKKPKLQKRSGSGKKGIVTHPLSESQWNSGLFSMIKWESEKHKSWRMPSEGFKDHVATDMLGSGEHVVGLWCSWITMKNWDPCMECTAQWRQTSRSSAPARGRS